MNEKQQQLTFEKGITNVPSDALCSDNALEESLGMVYENGEHRPIQKPKEVMTLGAGYTLLFVHTYGGSKRYIVKRSIDTNDDTVLDADEICWQTENGSPIHMFTTTLNSNVQVTSVGNTLIFSTPEGLRYMLWQGSDSTYKFIGNEIPDISVIFSLGDFREDLNYTENYIWLTEMLDGTEPAYYQDQLGNKVTIYGSKIREGKYEDVKNALIGLVSSRLNTVKENKRFAFPFWARYAIRLYDGSYTHISAPFLLLPTVLNNWHIYTCDDNGDEKIMDSDEHGSFVGGWEQTNYRPLSADLYFQTVVPGVNLSNWEDIIAGVDVFVSQEVKNFDMEGQWQVFDYGSNKFDGTTKYKDKYNPAYFSDTYPAKGNVPSSDDRGAHRVIFQPALLSVEDITKALVETSVFYKLFEVELAKINDYSGQSQAANGLIANRTVVNLTTQEQLPYDDYFSHTMMIPNIIKTFNQRLHIANYERSFFDGFDSFSFTSFMTGSTSDYNFYVYIKSNSGRTIVCKSVSQSREIPNIWFYYPDPRAYRLQIFNGNNDTLLYDVALKEHPYLNGAYYIGALVGADNPVDVSTPPPTVNNANEKMEDHIQVSEVNNPMLFLASGDTVVGMGEVKGLATQVMSTGEQEHGIHPLTVFSERGISLLRLNNDGTYLRSDEISREILDNPKSILETDGAVFFSSKKGLMMVAGQEVRCVSEQLRGKLPVSMVQTMGLDGSNESFASFIRQAFMAYDYRDSLLWIFDGATHNGQTGSRYCYVYSLKDGVFGRYDFGQTAIENIVEGQTVTTNVDNIVTNVVNSYPDYLLQIGTKVFSLLERPDINVDGVISGNQFTPNTYNCKLVTRPMKLENALALKSIMQIRHIYAFSAGSGSAATMTLRIFASNNLTSWVELHSLRGTPWKYYKFQYDFSNLLATDRFAGTMLITQERRTSKLR